MKKTIGILGLFLVFTLSSEAQMPMVDWILDGRAYRAEIKKEGENHIILENGLNQEVLRCQSRIFRLQRITSSVA